jgi:hypothetical protein
MKYIINNLCGPAIIYLGFQLTTIIINIYNKLYEDAIIQFFSTVIITWLLNILCKKGFATVSWMIVFIPFILMTLIISTIIFMFGIKPQRIR